MGEKTTTPLETVRPDNKGRITLGHRRTEGISGFKLEQRSDGVIVLYPQQEIPAREAWLWKNKAALASVMRGLDESAAGKTSDWKEDFTRFVVDADK